jgi:hypothetical protein
MKPVKLIDLVGKDVSGVRADVNCQDGATSACQDTPMYRVLERVWIEQRKGKTWLRWSWIPEVDVCTGKKDCGFSGVTDHKSHLMQDAYIFIDE